MTPARADAVAERLWATRCSACHGAEGRGDGPGVGSLAVAPPDLGSPELQRRVSDEFLRQVIVGGGLAVGRSAVMPRNADLADEPLILDALVRRVRSLAREDGTRRGDEPEGRDEAPPGS